MVITSSTASLSPACLFSIFDQFQRRSELCTGRLIGAIYGNRQEVVSNNHQASLPVGEELEKVSILQAFPIPHSELNDGQVKGEALLLILNISLLQLGQY